MDEQDRMARLYQHLWQAHADVDFGILDQSRQPRDTAMLYDLADQIGLAPEDKVLDVGCGRGYHACELADRYGCQVIGLDAAANNLRPAYALAMKRGLSHLVTFRSGLMESLPLEDKSVDLVWCHDMLVHVKDLEAGLSECQRVLSEGGFMIILATLGTDLLFEEEVDHLFKPLNIQSRNLDAHLVEQSFEEAGLHLLSRESIAGERLEFLEERDGQYSKEFRRLTRMIRNPEHYASLLGQTRYDIARSVYYWSIYLLIGKLTDVIYLLRK